MNERFVLFNITRSLRFEFAPVYVAEMISYFQTMYHGFVNYYMTGLLRLVTTPFNITIEVFYIYRMDVLLMRFDILTDFAL